jgi:ABC-type uncharacterized transport system permease subunit
MRSKITEYEIDFAVRVLDEPFHKFYYIIGFHLFFIDHEPDFALNGYCKNQIDFITFSGKSDPRCVTTECLLSPMAAVIAKTGLTSPLDFDVLFFSAFADGRILLHQAIFWRLCDFAPKLGGMASVV